MTPGLDSHRQRAVRAKFPHEEERPSMKSALKTLALPILIAIACALCVAAVISTSGCKPGWNDPPPITPEPGMPCGRRHYVCHDVCCYETDICRPGGYCVFGGNEGPTWGASRDGGPEPGYRGLTPDQVRHQQVAP
jgi:hypothetical protein